MKKILACAIFLLPIQLALATGTFVREYDNGTTNTVYVNTATAPTAGDTLMFFTNTSAGAGTPTVTALSAMSAANGAGTVLASFTIPTALATTSYNTGSAFGTGGYVLSVPSGVASIVATYSGGTPGTVSSQVIEVSGLSAYIIGARNFQAAPGTTANAITSTTGSVTSIPAYILGSISNQDSDTTAGTGFTIRGTVTNQWADEDRRETGATGSYAATATAATHGATDSYLTTEIAFTDSGGASCTHAGQAKDGSTSVPNGSSGFYWGKSGSWVTPDCATVNYWSPAAGNFAVN